MTINLSKTKYSIVVRPPLFRGEGSVIGNFAELAENLSLSIAYDGPNECTFDITTKTKPIGELAKLFMTLLGKDVSIDTGNPIWRGYINQLIFSSGQQARQKELADIVNEVDVSHTGGVDVGFTVPAVSVESQVRFGRRVVQQTDSADLTLADARLQAEQTIRARAFARPKMIGRRTTVGLRVHCIGYLSILDWCTTELTGTEKVSEAIEHVIDTCGNPIITYGTQTIQANNQFWTSPISGTGLQLIRKLERIPDSNGNLWRFYIDTDNVAHWEPIEFTPAYEIRQGISEASSGVFKAYYGGRKIRPFEPKAGVIIRDATYPIELAYPGSPFQSAQDAYVEMIKFDAMGNASFESGDLIEFGATDAFGT